MTSGDRLSVARRVLVESDVPHETLDALRREVERDYRDGNPLLIAEVTILRADLNTAYQDALEGTRHKPPAAPADGTAPGNGGAGAARTGGEV